MISGPWAGKRLMAIVYLAIAFWRRQFRRVLRRGEDDGGERRFLENFVSEGMKPLTAAQEEHILAMGRCIHCGLCEATCPEPLDQWAAYSRAIAQAEDAAAVIPARCPEGCTACASICPTGVPLAEIPAFVHRPRG